MSLCRHMESVLDCWTCALERDLEAANARADRLERELAEAREVLALARSSQGCCPVCLRHECAPDCRLRKVMG